MSSAAAASTLDDADPDTPPTSTLENFVPSRLRAFLGAVEHAHERGHGHEHEHGQLLARLRATICSSQRRADVHAICVDIPEIRSRYAVARSTALMGPRKTPFPRSLRPKALAPAASAPAARKRAKHRGPGVLPESQARSRANSAPAFLLPPPSPCVDPVPAARRVLLDSGPWECAHVGLGRGGS
ncbi:hypothetical protein GY45DRAFT_182743 [Cubamyces sp. BRFM 1775]|nr:hypothetical protein GY45DRAFT_182743 [Cubamyces sp. BRFM 1775]